MFSSELCEISENTFFTEYLCPLLLLYYIALYTTKSINVFCNNYEMNNLTDDTKVKKKKKNEVSRSFC